MSRHFTVVPASTQSGRETIRVLLSSESKPSIRAIYRDPTKAPAEFTQSPNFEAVKGDVSSGEGIDFTGTDAVLYIPPPTYDGTDPGEFATRAAENVRNAVQKAASVKRLVVHSAMGAQNENGIGVLRINHITDRILESAAAEVHIVKPGWFYEMWADALKTMQTDTPHFESPFSPADYKVPMVSVRDVGAYCAKALLAESPQPALRSVTLFGPRHVSALDLKKAIEEVTGKEGKLTIIERHELRDFFTKEVPEVYAQEFADMIVAILAGGNISHDFEDGEGKVRGELELVDVLRDLASQ